MITRKGAETTRNYLMRMSQCSVAQPQKAGTGEVNSRGEGGNLISSFSKTLDNKLTKTFWDSFGQKCFCRYIIYDRPPEKKKKKKKSKCPSKNGIRWFIYHSQIS